MSNSGALASNRQNSVSPKYTTIVLDRSVQGQLARTTLVDGRNGQHLKHPVMCVCIHIAVVAILSCDVYLE